MTKWFKHTFVCNNGECDALYEISSKESMVPACFEPECQVCGCKVMNTVSVVDVTISQGTDNDKLEEEEIMEQTIAELYNPHLLVTYKRISAGEATYFTKKVTDLEWELDQAQKSISDRTLFNNQRFLVDNIISSAYEDSDDKDTLREIANALDINLTKEVSWTATVTISGSTEVNLLDEDFDLEAEVTDEIRGQLYDYDISVDDVEEN